MPHIVEGPGIFNDEHRYPLWFIVNCKHKYSEDARNRINYEKKHIKDLLVPGLLLVVSDIQKPIP